MRCGRRRVELGFLERLQVAVDLAFKGLDVGAHAGELLFVLWAIRAGLLGGLGERVVDELPVAVDGGELGEHGSLKAILR